MGPRFYLQIMPLAALGAVGTAVGLQAASIATGPAPMAAALAIGLGSFVAARTFRGYAGWMPLFIAGLSLAAGVVLARLGWSDGPAPAAVAVGILLLMAILGRAVPRWFSVLYTPLWLSAWLLVIGLIGLWLAGGVGAWTVPLSLIIALVFAGLSAAWFARLPPEPLPVAAMELYLLGFNLFLALGILQGGLV
jgi:hypothetical protein